MMPDQTENTDNNATPVENDTASEQTDQAQTSEESAAPVESVSTAAGPTKAPIQDNPEDFNLSRVFSLLSMIIGLMALGLISIMYAKLDDRLENVEKSYNVTIRSLDEKVNILGLALQSRELRLAEQKPAHLSSDAKELIVGSEIARTLYLMKYIAADEEFGEEIRQNATQVHAQADALMQNLEAKRK